MSGSGVGVNKGVTSTRKGVTARKDGNMWSGGGMVDAELLNSKKHDNPVLNG
jgi:hypothetical protein